MSSLNEPAEEVGRNHRTFYWAVFLDPLIANEGAFGIT